MVDGLEIAQGINRGEAAVLKGSSFDPVQQSRYATNVLASEQAKRKAEQEANFALLDDDIKAQWDTDVFNYFQPKVDVLKSEIMNRMKQTNGKLSPEDRFKYKAAWNKLQQEALVSNAVYKAYSDQVKKLEGDKTGAFDREVSIENLDRLKNPLKYDDTRVEVETKYGGDVMKWRADNAERFGLVPSFSREEYIMDITKGLKPQGVYVKNAKGEPELFKNEAGGYYNKVQTGITDDQLNAKVNAIWTGQSRNDVKTREADMQAVQSMFILDEMGKPIPVNAEDPRTQLVLKNAKLKGKTSEQEVWKELAKSYTYSDLRIRYPLSETIQKANRAPQGRTSSGGKGFNDRYTYADTNYETDPNIRLGKPNLAATLAGQGWVELAVSKGHKVRRRAIDTKTASGSDVETMALSISPDPVRPIAYLIDDNTGDVFFEYSEMKEVGIDAITKRPIFRMVNSSRKVDQEIEASIAAHYGFKSFEDFKREGLGYKGKKPAAQQTGGARQPAGGNTPPPSRWDKNKRK